VRVSRQVPTMRGSIEAAVLEAHPALGLSADLARRGGAVEQRRGHREVAAEGGDHGLRQAAHQPGRRPRGAERRDLAVAVQDFRRAVAHGARIVAENFVEHRNVVADQRLLVAIERGRHLGHDLRQVDVHASLPCAGPFHGAPDATISGAAVLLPWAAKQNGRG
jgi:hypothetical protein